ncbi:hypothetical protein GGS21DRAFT_491792 [Xylaria nigripes]|nr:hypothetical protein GGS21DRAFT_491792 [Xylaria nigripes]
MATDSYMTFGVELEFLVFYLPHNQTLPEDDIGEYGPILVAPEYVPKPDQNVTPENPGVSSGGNENEGIFRSPESQLAEMILRDETERFEADWVRQRVAESIKKRGFKSQAWYNDVKSSTDPDIYKIWNVVPDCSLSRVPIEIVSYYWPLRTIDVEINSPIFVAGEDAFREISAVIEAITSSFRVSMPPLCGFHVHVGRNRLPLELRPVQRTASLLWVAENLLGVLHPGCRHNNDQCPSMRLYSSQAMGMTIEKATRHPNGLGEAQHAEFSLDKVSKTQWEKPTNFPTSKLLAAAASHGSSESREWLIDYGLRVRSIWSETTTHSRKHNSIIGVNNILRATDVGAIHELLSDYQGCRGAYSFANMAYDKEVKPRTGPEWTLNQRNPRKVRKPTIEFRQAAGSLDMKWVIVWAKICVALCGPVVVDSSDEDFFQLLYRCIEAGDDPSKYDVFDFLHDIGISKDDIAYVHDRLVRERHETEPVLGFFRPESSVDLIEDLMDAWEKGQPLSLADDSQTT